MWPRKQLDIGWTDLAFGLGQLIAPWTPPDTAAIVGDDWLPPQEVILSLSVRSGLDLLLAALELPPGSEVLISAVTIPDMPRIIEHHGLVPVPVDVDPRQLQPVLEHLERSITSRTRAILVAHLFGTHIDMEPIIAFAKQHDLLVIEDCAQAFIGRDYAGHPESTCALFSFGPIKTATALGGAVIRVPNADLRQRMLALQNAYPRQSRGAYAKRLAKYTLFRALGNPINYGLLVRALPMFGVDYDRALGNAAHSFKPNDFFAQIRRRPCTPLLRMLARRITRFDLSGAARLRRRTLRGNQLARVVPERVIVGEANATHTYWVVPIRAANRDALIAELRAAGFDGTARSSLVVVGARNREALGEPAVAPWLAETIFVPGGEDMPDDQWARVIAILEQHAIPVPAPAPPPESVPAPATSELFELTGVPVAS
jgi:perosamine synthetase